MISTRIDQVIAILRQIIQRFQEWYRLQTKTFELVYTQQFFTVQKKGE